jgi:polyhydroxyalkanoate synthase subunit PhaC
LADIKIPVYNLAAKEDHIAPAKSVFLGCKYFGGEVEYVMAGSGHIAGVINPPAAGKYQHWTNGPPRGEFEQWVEKVEETAGSWWPNWQRWVAARAPKTVPARKPGAHTPILEDAPGSYVKVRV